MQKTTEQISCAAQNEERAAHPSTQAQNKFLVQHKMKKKQHIQVHKHRTNFLCSTKMKKKQHIQVHKHRTNFLCSTKWRKSSTSKYTSTEQISCAAQNEEKVEHPSTQIQNKFLVQHKMKKKQHIQVHKHRTNFLCSTKWRKSIHPHTQLRWAATVLQDSPVIEWSLSIKPLYGCQHALSVQ